MFRKKPISEKLFFTSDGYPLRQFSEKKITKTYFEKIRIVVYVEDHRITKIVFGCVHIKTITLGMLFLNNI